MQGRQAQRGVGCSLASSRAGQNAAASAHAQHQRALFFPAGLSWAKTRGTIPIPSPFGPKLHPRPQILNQNFWLNFLLLFARKIRLIDQLSGY